MRPLWASVKMAGPAPGNRARGAAPSTPTACAIFALHIHRMQYICAVDALRMQFVCASHMRTRHALCMHYSIYALHALHVTHTHTHPICTLQVHWICTTHTHTRYMHTMYSLRARQCTAHALCAVGRMCPPRILMSHLLPRVVVLGGGAFGEGRDPSV